MGFKGSKGFKVQGSGFRVQGSSGSKGSKGGTVHHHLEAPRSFRIYVIRKR